MLPIPDSLASGHDLAARMTSGCRRLFGSLALGLTCLLAPAASAQSPPASFTANFTNGGNTVAVNFTLHPMRSTNFSVIVQNSSGGFDPHTAPAAATYLGTPVGYPGALGCATLRADGTLLARIMFEDATTWTTNAGTVAGGAASPSGDPNWAKQWPGFTMASGGAGSNQYAAELGIDSSYDHFNRSGLVVNDNLSIIEHSVLCANVLYLREAGIVHRIGRVVMRGNQLQDPYRNLTGGGLLNETANQWNNVLPPSTHDVTAMLSASSVGGGLAWVGVIGTSSRYSVNDSDGNGDFSVIGRHEVGHNWGANHYEGNAPEGPTIMSNNALSRISSPELRKIVDHRNTKLGILDNLGPYSFPLPPRASLDIATAIPGSATTINVMDNDHDGNGQTLSILSFDPVSNLGGQVSQSAGNLVLQSVADHGQVDWFNYRIQDTAGRTATGIVYVQGENPSTKLTGTGIGTSGAYCCGYTFDKALDGNLTTFYDADSATGDWVGLDLGAGNTKAVTKVKYAARAGHEGRMNGGMIQGSTSADFSSGVVTLFTISSAPSGVLTSTSINNSAPYRYVRYLGPADGWCNIAEIEFWGANPTAPNPPNGVTASGAGAGLINLSWNAATFATGYNVKRATVSGGPYTTIAPNIATTTFGDSGLVAGATYYYVVSAVNATGEGANSAQVSAVASPTPSSDWMFDDGSGTVATDSSANGNDGTVNGAAWVTGFAGTALQFDGVNSFVTFGTGPSVSGLNDFTVAAWIKTTATTNGVIIQQRDAAGFNGQYRFSANTNGTLKFMVYGDSAYQFDFATTQTINDGNWHHVVAVRDGTVGSIYIDGNPTPAATASGTTRNLAASISTAVGRDVRDNNQNFNGSIDEVLVYKTIALNGSEVESLYDSYFGPPPPPPTPTGLVATPGNNQVALSWNASSGATSYNVKRSTTSGGPYGTIASPGGTSFTDTTAVNGTTYYYVVSAVNAGGESGNSTQASATPQGSAPTFVAAGTIASGTGTIAPALPSGLATGDILLLFVETANQTVSVSASNGGTWTQVTGSPQGTGTAAGSSATRLTAFWSRYNGTQGAPTLSDSGNHQSARMIAIRGAAASGNPWDVTAGGVEATSDTSASVPGATTTVANTLVVIAVAGSLPDANGTSNFSGWTNANLTSLTERTDNTTNAGNGGALGIATGGKATAGAYGNTAVTHGSSAVKGMISIAIKN